MACFGMGLSLGSHGCVTLECCLHEAPAPRLITFYFCQECWCAQSPWKCVGRIFVKYLLKNLLVCPEKNCWGPQKQMGFCPKYVFCVFLVGMCQERSLWINIQPCSIPVLSWGALGCAQPLLHCWGMDLHLWLGFPTWAHISDPFWKEGREKRENFPCTGKGNNQ